MTATEIMESSITTNDEAATANSSTMAVWKDCKSTQSFGIAKSNFEQDDRLHRLTLDVGDAVVILKETTHWFYGYKQRNKKKRGIFPKSYIHLCEYKIINGEYCIKRTDIVEEITKVLLEWGSILKQFFLINHPDFQRILIKMNDLNNKRAMLISCNLPVDEMRKVKLEATSEIDTGNNLLHLDMVVRDESGDILDTNKICTTELYENHLNAVNRIITANRAQSTLRPLQNINKHSSHNILLHVIAIVCKLPGDSELLFTLFDGESHKPICENYVVKWSQTGMAYDIDQFDNNRVLFTDLSKGDLNLSKIYLVCYAVRIGPMEIKDTLDSKRSSITNSMLTAASKKNSQLSINSTGSSGNHEHFKRRPFGVACVDLTPLINKSGDCKNNLDLPFIMCDKDNLDGTLRKLILNKDIGKIESKMAVSIEVFQGDIKQIKEEFPRLVHTNVPVARKMGFPEVILPGDVRNDLYLTLCYGEFSRLAKTSEKNIEVAVSVHNEQGQLVPGVLSMGAGISAIDKYNTVVYYHDDKPKWWETLKIHVPIEEFKQCHLRFMFKHRSSNEQKDKSEKPFAMSYVKLMQDNGTTISQGQHVLCVYRIDHKKYGKSNELIYMELPANVTDLHGNKPSIGGLSLLQKDQFVINVNLCSTKLTQSVSLLGLLNWAADRDTLEDSLKALSNVPGEEVVKFLQDILDALFNILVENDDPARYDQLTFMSIIHLIEIVSELKYQHFLSVLDVYIKDSFSATLAYVKLVEVLKRNIRDAIEPNDNNADREKNEERLYKTTRYLHYVMKFIIRSRKLFADINGNTDLEDFTFKMHDLLKMFIQMINSPMNLLKSEGALLKNLHIMATDLMQVFDPVRLSVIVVNILARFPPQRLTQSKMGCIKDFVDSKLFHLPECRVILLPVFCNHIKDRIESKEEGDWKSDLMQHEKNLSKVAKVLGQFKGVLLERESTAKIKVTECINILNNMLKLLYRSDVGSTHNDINHIVLILLRTIMKTSHTLDRENPLVGNLVAIMLGILQRMDAAHYETLVKSFENRTELQNFIIEILLVFKELVSPHQKPVFSSDWMDMIMHKNTVILGSLQQLAVVITDYFLVSFEKQVWSNFFHCSIAFLIQSPLQLNDFNDNKRQIVFARYRDIRKDTADEICKMWFQLGQYKPKFVPELVEPVLEMSMIPENELRKATIPIIFDMMQCEYYSSKLVHESYGDTKSNSDHIKANFNDFETEMIEKLDILIGAGKADEQYKELFQQMLLEKCQAHNKLCVEGTKFVCMVSKLMDRLLEYRCIIQDESKENRMACTFSLLQFYSEVNRKEMYIRYVYKLFDLHMEFEHYTEAAFTLKLHTELLKWNDSELSPLLRSHRYIDCRTHRELKEQLYSDIINYFDKGKMWECAIEMCKVLVQEYENEIYDYQRLAELLKQMSIFYDKISKELRHTSEYFRVVYYGLGFPRFLQNKSYIYRGMDYERLDEFSVRILAQHPQAELMTSLQVPGENITQSNGQYVQINKVEPDVDETLAKFNDKVISSNIIKYLKNNNVQKFKFSRPFFEEAGADTDEVRSMWLERTILITAFPLPGILRWFPITQVEKYKISPIERAVETMKLTNKEIRDLIIKNKNDENSALSLLTMKLTGIIDPAVMGGLSKYEEAFLCPEYLEMHPENAHFVDELKESIASQIPLLEIAVRLHKQKATEDYRQLQERLETCFRDMQASVESKYGKKSCDLKLDRDSVIMRRSYPIFDSNRLSETSMGSSDSGLAKSTFSMRIPMGSIKPSSFSINSRSISHTPSIKSKTKDKTVVKKRPPKTSVRNTASMSVAKSQWYTTPLSTITSTPERETNTSLPWASNASLNSKSNDPHVLTEELTPKRPLRSEKEKERRLSRPASIATPTTSVKSFTVNDTQSLSGADSSNRNSAETTDSTSEEDLTKPPPLPVKTRDSTDYSSLNSNMDWNFRLASPTSTCTNISFTSTLSSPTICRDNNYSKLSSFILKSYEPVEATNFCLTDERKRPPTPPPKPTRNNKHIP